jgi:hypothetical protein
MIVPTLRVVTIDWRAADLCRSELVREAFRLMYRRACLANKLAPTEVTPMIVPTQSVGTINGGSSLIS